mmetsp:Transcript_26825/g.77009  ORF Transcript_26825/g.77009 Transcript_26825/m.77009 type:complete len:101 (-) Transcript_26825:698-1000(-)
MVLVRQTLREGEGGSGFVRLSLLIDGVAVYSTGWPDCLPVGARGWGGSASVSRGMFNSLPGSVSFVRAAKLAYWPCLHPCVVCVNACEVRVRVCVCSEVR